MLHRRDVNQYVLALVEEQHLLRPDALLCKVIHGMEWYGVIFKIMGVSDNFHGFNFQDCFMNNVDSGDRSVCETLGTV